MVKNLIKYIVLFNLSFIYAQGVGINTTNPVSKLDIESTANNLPTLQIEPQVNPVGNSNGDLSVIGDKLYKYDTKRGKWLSIESSIYNFAENGNAQIRLEYTGDIEITGPIIPMDATITGVSIACTGGTLNKGVHILLNGVELPNNDAQPSKDGLIHMVGYKYQNNDYDVNVKANDNIMVRLENNGTTVTDIKVELILKWRK